MPLLVGLALVALDAAVSAAAPFLVRIGVDAGVVAHRPMLLLGAASALRVLALLGWWLQRAETLVTTRVGESMLLVVRSRLFPHLQALGVDVIEREPAGHLLTWLLTSDVETLSQLLQEGLVSTVVGLLSVAVVAVVLVVLDLRLAVVALAGPHLVGLATVGYRILVERAYDRQREQIAAVNAFFQEPVGAIHVVQVLGQQGEVAASFAQLVVASRTPTCRPSACRRSTWPSTIS